MLSLLISVKKLFSSFLGILKKEDTRALFFLLATTLLSGTIFYSTVEKLSPLDSLYLSFMTLTTIGYATVGLGIMAMFISVVAKSYLYSKQSHHHHHHKNKEHSAEKSSEK